MTEFVPVIVGELDTELDGDVENEPAAVLEVCACTLINSIIKIIDHRIWDSAPEETRINTMVVHTKCGGGNGTNFQIRDPAHFS